jgi:predicted CoA-substrate-specific enzyme activase
MYIGVDVGSVATKAVLLDEQFKIVEDLYLRNHGQPLQRARELLSRLVKGAGQGRVQGVAVTGAGGKLLGSILDVPIINEVVAQATATGHYYPEVRTIIEIGGEDSKLILIEPEGATGRTRIRDFAMNALCAAGTGSFLDQQATRLGISIENEWGAMALQSQHPPRIAGRCSVFAKSDMIHLQQEGCPDYDIVAGLCFAMARNFRAVIGKGKEFLPQVSFQGGVAANAGMIRAFRELLELDKETLIIPKHHASMGAIGALLAAAERRELRPFKGLEALARHLEAATQEARDNYEPLVDDQYPLVIEPDRVALEELNRVAGGRCRHPSPLMGEVPPSGGGEGDEGRTSSTTRPTPSPGPEGPPSPIKGEGYSNGRIDVFVGVDVGSISTNIVAIDAQARVLSRRYLMTGGKPLEAVTQGLYEVGCEVGDRVRVCGVGTTGSDRYLTGDFIGADIVKNEITAHATAAAAVDANVDTIFEIGGQDSKYISLENGAVVDFAMNKVCAAGTGSFIEEQSERLGIGLKNGEFNRLALSADEPPCMGERCTVFIETDINHNLQKGVAQDDIASALCYSIVHNYLNRVVEDRRVGQTIFFQGGTAYNRGVKSAFEKVTGKKIIVPPHHDIMGAVGAAMLARDARDEKKPSRFRGFDLRDRQYDNSSFECKACSNLCEVRVVDIKGQGKLFYGSRCGKFDESKQKSRGDHLPRLFVERNDLLMATYNVGARAASSSRGAQGRGSTAANSAAVAPGLNDSGKNKKKKTVGVPRIAPFWEYYPMYSAFFGECGFEVVPSEETNRTIINAGLETVAAEACYPIKVAHGHALDLLEKGVDYLFLPSVVDLPQASDKIVNSYACPYVQALPYLISGAVDFERYPQTRVLSPIFHMSRGRNDLRRRLETVARHLGVGISQRRQAIDAGLAAQDEFYRRLRARGHAVLKSLGDEPVLVIVSRPYNGCDSGLNLNIPEKLRDLGCLAIPMDMLPLESEDIAADYPHMYWKYGQKILAAARIIARHPNLYPVYITNFGCGPDSFITKFFERELKGKPCLTLEVDEHSADVGAITRCEAYLDSLKNVRRLHLDPVRKVRAGRLDYNVHRDGKRRLYIPYMDDDGYAIAAAMRANGVDAVQMPMADQRTIELGRKVTSGKECYPCIITTGDILRQVEQPDFDPQRAAFFMPTAFGPCRFGQYNKFQRMVLDDMGLAGVPIVTFDQDKDYQQDAKMLGPKFHKLAWSGVIFVDTMQKLLRQTRPYEVVKGETDRIYQESLDQFCRHIESGGQPAGLGAEVRRRFEAIRVDRSERRPRIGLVGEVFVRSNEFTNNFIVRKIEQLGGEACLPPFEEWVNYIAWSRQQDGWSNRNLKRIFEEFLVGIFQKKEKQRVLAPFAGSVRDFFVEAPSSEVIALGRRYLHESVRGEPILSMGRVVEYARHGFDGVVNLLPFNCMPGTMVNAFLTKFQNDFDMPVLKVAYDGLEQATEMIRLEAFMHQCRQKADIRRASASAAVAAASR